MFVLGMLYGSIPVVLYNMTSVRSEVVFAYVVLLLLSSLDMHAICGAFVGAALISLVIRAHVLTPVMGSDS